MGNTKEFKKCESVDEVIASMPERFHPENCQNLQAVYQWELSEPDKFFHVIINNGTFQLEDGKHEKANVTIMCSTVFDQNGNYFASLQGISVTPSHSCNS